MKLRGCVFAVLVLGAMVATPIAVAGAAGGVVQTAPVPVLCYVTLGHFPTEEVVAPVVTAPVVVSPGGTLEIRGLSVPGLTVPPNGSGSVTYRIVDGGTETVVVRTDFAPFDLDVPVTGAVGSIVEVRLSGYSTSEPVPELGITFNRSCSAEGQGIFARATVGGVSCQPATGTAGLTRGLLSVPQLPQRMNVSVRATDCTAAESATIRVRMHFNRLPDLTCTQSLPSAGVAGSGRIRWIAFPLVGGVSHVSFTARPTGSRDLIDVSGVILDGPHAGESVGLTVALTPKTACDGVTPLKQFTVTTSGAVLV